MPTLISSTLQSSFLRLDQRDRFLLSKKELENAKKIFIEFYRIKLNEKIKPLIERYEDQIGVKANTVKVMELKTVGHHAALKATSTFIGNVLWLQ